MSAFPPRFFLRTDETVRLEARMVGAWALEPVVSSLFSALVFLGAAAAVNAFLAPRDSRLAFELAAAFGAALLLASAAYAWRRVVTTEYVVSQDTVYTRRGRLLLHLNSAPLDRITDLHVHTGILGRLFGYSSLVVRTAGGGLDLPGLKDAYQVRGVLHETRKDYVARLLADSGRAQSKPSARRRAARLPSNRCRCPRCQEVLAVPPERPVHVVCPRCSLAGILFEEAPTA